MRSTYGLFTSAWLSITLVFPVRPQSVGIGTSTPDPSARLEVTATNQGILIPRLTTAQRNSITNPAHALLIFNLDSVCFEFYNAQTGHWSCIGTSSPGPSNPPSNSFSNFPPCWALGDSQNNYGHRIIWADANHLVVAGSTFRSSSYDMYVVKLDLNGNIVWSRTIGDTTGNDYGLDVAVDSFGDIIVVGYTNSFGAGDNDAYVVKLDPNGNVVWTQTLGGSNDDRGLGVATDGTGNIFIAGWTRSYGSGDYDMYISKLAPNGLILWSQAVGGSAWDVANAVASDGAGNPVVVGHTGSFGAGNYDIYVVKLDGAGNIAWTTTFGGTNYEEGRDVAINDSGEIIVLGETLSFGNGTGDFYITKLSSNGNILWSKTVGDTAYEGPERLIIDAASNILAVGRTLSFGGGLHDIYVTKLDDNGNLLWSRSIGDTVNNYGTSAVADGAGNFLVMGYGSVQGFAPNDIYFTRLDPNGVAACSAGPCQTHVGGSLLSPSPTISSGGTLITSPSTTGSGGAVGSTGTTFDICP